jgi:hypothetical protein
MPIGELQINPDRIEHHSLDDGPEIGHDPIDEVALPDSLTAAYPGDSIAEASADSASGTLDESPDGPRVSASSYEEFDDPDDDDPDELSAGAAVALTTRRWRTSDATPMGPDRALPGRARTARPENPRPPKDAEPVEPAAADGFETTADTTRPHAIARALAELSLTGQDPREQPRVADKTTEQDGEDTAAVGEKPEVRAQADDAVNDGAQGSSDVQVHEQGGESAASESDDARADAAGGDGPTDPPDGGRPGADESPEDDEPRRVYELKNIPSMKARGDAALPERPRNYTNFEPHKAEQVRTAQATPTIREVSPKGKRISHTIAGVGSAVINIGKAETARLKISVNPELQDTGVGHRLAMASADELVKQGIRVAKVDIQSEAGLRTLVSVYGNSLSFAADGFDDVLQPTQALEVAQAERPVYAIIDVDRFLETHYEYRPSRNLNIQVIDRVNLNDVLQSEELVSAEEIGTVTQSESDEAPAAIAVGGDVSGPVRGFKERVKGLRNPAEAEHAFTVFEEMLANWKAHVFEFGLSEFRGNAGEDHGFVVLYREFNPQTEQWTLCLSRYHHNVGHPNDITDFTIVDRLDEQANPKDIKKAEAQEQSGAGAARAAATPEEAARERRLEDLANKYEAEGKPERAAAIRRAKDAAEAGRGSAMTRRYTLQQGVYRILDDHGACVGGEVFYRIRSEPVEIPKQESDDELSEAERLEVALASFPDLDGDDTPEQQV